MESEEFNLEEYKKECFQQGLDWVQPVCDYFTKLDPNVHIEVYSPERQQKEMGSSLDLLVVTSFQSTLEQYYPIVQINTRGYRIFVDVQSQTLLVKTALSDGYFIFASKITSMKDIIQAFTINNLQGLLNENSTN